MRAPSVTLLLATPLSVVMVAPAVVPEMLNVAAALATLTWLDVAMLPVPSAKRAAVDGGGAGVGVGAAQGLGAGGQRQPAGASG